MGAKASFRTWRAPRRPPYPGTTRAARGTAQPVLFVRLYTCGGNRTPNRRFWRPVLYQLSYARSTTSGQGRSRTADTTIFSRVLYQLSYLARPVRPSRL
jgi:hypothetical protein